MIYNFNLKEIGPGFSIDNICDLPVIKVWNSNVSQKERYVSSMDSDSTDAVWCTCKDFRNSTYPNDTDWSGGIEKQVYEGDTNYYYMENQGRR